MEFFSKAVFNSRPDLSLHIVSHLFLESLSIFHRKSLKPVLLAVGKHVSSIIKNLIKVIDAFPENDYMYKILHAILRVYSI